MPLQEGVVLRRRLPKEALKAHKADCKGKDKAAPSPAAVCVGSPVQLRNLPDKPELNGQRGEVVGQDTEAGCWRVRLSGGGGIQRVTEFQLFVVPSSAASDDPSLALVEKQESELNHWGTRILSYLRPVLTEERDLGSGRTFCEHFEAVWRGWGTRERAAFLEAVLEQVRSTCNQPFPPLWTAMAVTELSEKRFVSKPSHFIKWIAGALHGEVDTSRMREAAGMKGALSGKDEFCLGIEELRGHPKRLEFELRIYTAFCLTVKVHVLQSFFDLGISAFAN